ANPRSI
ncbi:bacteriophage replication gene A family protein, partial [Vibrio parahaemolyticus V14/01]